MNYETEKLEFKEIAKDDLYKEAIAFANMEGGIMLLGINNAGEVMPIADIDDTYHPCNQLNLRCYRARCYCFCEIYVG